MERESFENEDVARLLNERFVAIKVDREERPDIDQVYMSVCMAMTGQGGWPLTIVMTPDQKPFFAGTYFPPTARYGRSGLLDVLPRLAEAWHTQKERLMEIGEDVARALNGEAQEDDMAGGEAESRDAEGKKVTGGGETDSNAAPEATPELCQAAYRHFVSMHDKKYGGFGSAPKFPSPHNLLFLTRHGVLANEPQALEMVARTLQCMYRGGIWDHLGYGFSRYSTDHRWLVPHFEKMLYDNALLAYASVEAWEASGDPFFSELARRTIHYVLRDMTGVDGEFYSGEDADSEGVEGKFYTFTPKQVAEVLPDPEARVFCKQFDVSKLGNFEGVSVLNLLHNGEALFDARRDALAQRVWAARERRVRPLRDDKVLTGWNALMIAALAKAGRALSDAGFIRAALRAYDFLENNLRRVDGRWLARYRMGEARHLGCLDDYAYVAFAQLELFEALGEPDHLKKCLLTVDEVEDLFGEGNGQDDIGGPEVSKAVRPPGGYYFYGHDGETLLSRPKEYYDGALPSGNSAMAYVLARLVAITDSAKLRSRLDRQLAACNQRAKEQPASYSFYLLAVLQAVHPRKEIVLVGEERDPALAELRTAVRDVYMPTAVVLVKTPETQQRLEEMVPYVGGHRPVDGRSAAYVCTDYACRAPVTDREALRALLH